MAKFTIELRKIIEYYGYETVKSWFTDYNLSDYLLPKQLETVQNTSIWNKDKLADKIIRHFFMREIGFETIELFAHYAKITMEEIMESKLLDIYTTTLEYDPLINVDFTETFNRKADTEGSNSRNF